MEAIENLGPVWFIQGEKGGRYPFCHSVYIPEAGILIDPASSRNVLISLKESIQTIWLSHWHEDHILHLDLFADTPIQLHELDEPPLQDINTYVNWYNLEVGRDDQLINHWKTLLVEQFHFQPRSAAGYLKNNDVIDLGSVTVEVIHAPGHSPGNLAFFFREPEILFIGDNDLTRFGPWYGDRYSDIDQIIETIGMLRKIPAKIWLTGHEEGIHRHLSPDVWDRYLQVIQGREEKLYDLLREPKSLDEIGKAWIVYGKPIEPVLEFEMIERVSMKKHAERLLAKGLITLENGCYVRTG